MTEHFHVSIDAVLVYGISAIIVINLLRILFAKMAQLPGPVGAIGVSLGALVHFGG
jgi:hypothetical protein